MAFKNFSVSERNTRHAENQNIESRAKNCALKKVPHLKSSPRGRGEERCAELCKGLPKKERIRVRVFMHLPTLFVCDSFYSDLALRLAGLSQIESKLHSHQVFHLRPEGLLDPQAHLARGRCFLIQQARKRLPPDAEYL